MLPATTTTTEQALAAEVASRLEALGASQNFLAEYTGISSGEMSKILNGIRPQDSARVNQIRKALQELEEFSKLFHPLRLAFDDADAVRSVIHSPVVSLPNLFRVIANAELLQHATPQEFAIAQEILRKTNEECARMETEIAAIREKTHTEWLKFLEEANGR